MARLLLLAPAFHGYWESLSAELERRGHEVVAWPYDANDGVLRKVRTKVEELAARGDDALGERRRTRVTGAALEVLTSSGVDRVLAVKADEIGPEFWHEAHRRRLPVTLHLYDELRRMRWSDDGLAEAVGDGLLLTYSRQDLTHLRHAHPEARLWANAFDDRFSPTPRVRDEVAFIGARYPVREQILTALAAADVPVRAYGRDWSHHWFDRARTWNAPRPALPAERDVSRAEGYDVVGGARAALNVHSDQDGFTMRTFEIPGSGGLQLIDRPDVAELYDPGSEVLVWSSPEELVELCRRAGADPDWSRSIRQAGRRRTLAHHTYRQRVEELESWWA